MTRKTTTVAVKTVSAEKPAEKVAEKVEKTKKKATKEEVIEQPPAEVISSDDEAGTDSEEEVQNPVDSLMADLANNIATTMELVRRNMSDLKRLQKEIQLERKQNEKELKKNGKNKEKKKRSGSTGLDKLLKVSTQDFRQFVEKNYQQLKDADGNQIITDLTYDEDGSLMVSRKIAHRFVNAYVKHNNLQQYDDKKRIKMDKTLQKLFPDNAEKKDKSGKVIEEENFYFTSIMKAISSHITGASAQE